MKTINKKMIFKTHYWAYIFLIPFFVFYLGFNLFPTLYSFYIGLTDWDAMMSINDKNFIGLKNYIHLFTKDTLFYKSIINNMYLMVIYIPILLALGLFLALMLYRLTRGRRFFQTLNIMPYITTPVAIGVIFSFMFDWSTGTVNKLLLNFHIIDEGINWLGTANYARFILILILVWKQLGYYLVIYLAGLSVIPEELYEAAVVDGASSFQKFYYITLRLLKPTIVFLVVTSIIGGFQLFDEPMLLFGGSGGSAMLVGGPDRSCLTPIQYFYDIAFRSTTKLGYGAAIGYATFLIILIFGFISYKMMIRKEEQE
jgi:cellobiose transport system permease protein